MNHPPRIQLCAVLALCSACVSLFAQEVPQSPTAQGPLKVLSTTRAKINLNGLWKFQPAAEAAASKPIESDWGTMWVPGTWLVSGWDGGGERLGAIQDKGSGAAWDIPVKELGAAWYERTVEIPKEWAGRAILLDLRRVSTDAEVWVNGKQCGKVNWPYGSVDITKAVTPGESATLRLIVIATPDEGEIVNFMGYVSESKSNATLRTAGLVGEVFLESRPMGAHISDVFVQTSTRKGEIALDVELDGIKSAGDITLTASILDASGNEVKSLTQSVPVTAQETQVVKVAWPWSDATLWDIDQPNLYTLKLTAPGTG
jgi:beta-galactosidase